MQTPGGVAPGQTRPLLASRQGPILWARTKLPGKLSGGGQSVLSNSMDGALAGVLGQLLPWVLPNLWEHQLGHRQDSLEGAQGAATELARKPAGVPGDSAGIFPLGHWKSAGMPTDTVRHSATRTCREFQDSDWSPKLQGCCFLPVSRVCFWLN